MVVADEHHSIRIVITGATGFIGKSLVPLLHRAGAELLLVGRSAAKVREAFPGYPCCSYGDLATSGVGYDVLLHLACANNNVNMPSEYFQKVNVDFTMKVAEIAKSARIPCFINVSSVHALDSENDSAYAQSKRTAASRLKKLPDLRVVTIYLPAVYGSHYSGKLLLLNKLPSLLREFSFTFISSLKPTADVRNLAKWLLEDLSTFEHKQVIITDDKDKNPVYRGMKRAIDLSFALSVILLFWWLLLLIWILIKFESSGPALFAQERIGRNGKPFICYKFRTMKLGTPQAGTHEISSGAVTNIGRFLRRTKIDELPQFWNILRNELSLVGPRPSLVVQEELIRKREARGVLLVKPGITGLAQIRGVDMRDPEKLAAVDAQYVAMRSLFLDLRIMIATIRGRGQGDQVN